MSLPIKNAIQLEANPSLVGENHGRSFAPCRLQESCGAEISARRHPWASREHHGVPAAPVRFSVIFLLNPKFHPGLLIKSLPSGNFTLCYGKSQF